jgi:hypothetical protein
MDLEADAGMGGNRESLRILLLQYHHPGGLSRAVRLFALADPVAGLGSER